ncbi:MAG: helix-turn-helix domain-containing protein [Anaerolineales bacterium]|nr:helix-turn-helix domain-containing protein [Anaerolineales bacterium]
MKKEHIKLSKADRAYLEKLVSTGELAARVCRRAIGLLELDRGKTYSVVSQTLNVNHNTMTTWAENYKSEGGSCIQDKPRTGRPIEIDDQQRAQVTALACSEPPEGYSKWSLCWLTKRSWATVTTSLIARSETFSKKQTQTASKTDVVHRSDEVK